MPSADFSLSILLLVVCIALLGAILMVLLRIAGQLNGLRGGGDPDPARQPTEIPAPSGAETSPGGAFEAFLAEDPARRELSKGEQFSAYRKWRQENGMNWSNG